MNTSRGHTNLFLLVMTAVTAASLSALVTFVTTDEDPTVPSATPGIPAPGGASEAGEGSGPGASPANPQANPQGDLQAEPSTGPYTHTVGSATSNDGLEWEVDDGFAIEHVSVPAAFVRRDGTVILYFVDFRENGRPGSMDCMVSEDGATFEDADCEVGGFDGQVADPAPLAVGDEYWLYYFGAEEGAFAPGAEGADHDIRLATSDDGIHFEDQGVVFRDEGLVDPDVVEFDGAFYMYVFAGGERQTIVARSENGRDFERVADAPLDDCGTTKPIEISGGRLRLYCFDQTARGGGRVVSALSDDAVEWELEDGTRLKIDGQEVSDPYVVELPGGGYRMYFKLSNGQGAPGGVPPAGGDPAATPPVG